MEHNSGSRDDIISGLVAREGSKEIGLSSSKGKSRSKFRHHKGRCRYCKKERHWNAECPKLKDKKEKNSSDSASVAKGLTMFSQYQPVQFVMVGFFI